MYKEVLSSSTYFEIDRMPTNVPTACTKLRYEALNQINWILNDKFTNMIQTSHYDTAGHFAAMEEPRLVYVDLVAFVKKVLK